MDYFKQAGRETLEGSFSSVSTPIFASKYSFFSIFRDLQDVHSFAPLHTQKFSKISTTKFDDFCANLAKLIIFESNSSFFEPILMKISQDFTKFKRNS